MGGHGHGKLEIPPMSAAFHSAACKRSCICHVDVSNCVPLGSTDCLKQSLQGRVTLIVINCPFACVRSSSPLVTSIYCPRAGSLQLTFFLTKQNFACNGASGRNRHD